jgi:hypothetical protein
MGQLGIINRDGARFLSRIRERPSPLLFVFLVARTGPLSAARDENPRDEARAIHPGMVHSPAVTDSGFAQG